ncbi:MAG TPA: RNA polymerase subunit sigma-24 [Clostridiales bacterium]|nr:RNA polymerase subunit sigma-24 [Clostridiales bacterium]
MKIMSEQTILFGVPKVEYSGDGITPFPRCLKACANYLGMDVGYEYVMAASGAAFRLTWDTKAWNFGNVDVIFTFDDPSSVYRFGIESLGCEYNLIGRTLKTEKSEFISFVKTKIDSGYPCIALGIIGPPEACIITGYRDEGNTLLGWNFFQDNPEFAGKIEIDESGYYITNKWWENPETKAVMSLGEITQERYTPKMILQNAIEVMTGRNWKHYAKGISAYDAWAKAVLNDGDFPENAILPILAERLMVHGDAMDCLADGRHSASSYIKSLVSIYPTHKEKLEKAADLFMQVHKTFWKMNDILGDRGENGMRKFAKPQVRKQIADIIYEAKTADEKAFGIIKELVNLL